MEENKDNVLDLRVARWRRDPFMAEVLELVERASKLDDTEKRWLIAHMTVGVRAAENQMVKRTQYVVEREEEG